MKYNYEERRQNRIDYAKEKAAKLQKESNQLYNHAQKMASVIPMGQPILVGHHSEKWDRNYRGKTHNTFGKAVAAGDKADYYEKKAATIESNDAISSDDPQALDKLRKKLALLESTQEFMKSANKCVKSGNKVAFMKLPYATEKIWIEITTPDFLKRVGFPDYSLKNNNANIRSVKHRIAKLESIEQLATSEKTINDVRVVINTEANRVQLFFPQIPPEDIRKRLRDRGFRFSRSEGNAWQQFISNSAVGHAYMVAGLYHAEGTTK